MCQSKQSGGGGFRDLEAFNSALLAKQCWRLIQNENSLLYKVLKGRYFRDGSVMEAKISSNASFTWRSVLGSKPLLEKGIAWRVGNGKSIKVWDDRWLPNVDNPRIISPRRNLDRSAKVADLIVNGQPVWDNGVLDQEFLREEAALIRTIPISRCGLEDKRIWMHTKDGMFTVKSGYHLAKVNQQGLVASSSHGGSRLPTFNWKRLWSLPIPEKIKVFAWRAIRGILPTAENLIQKRVLIDANCKVCEEGPESIDHCFRYCYVARQVWMLSSLGIRSSAYDVFTERDWFVNMVQCFDKKQTSLFFIIAWSIWNCRNQFLFKGVRSHPMDVVRRAMSLFEECMELLGGANQRRKDREECRWVPPPVDHVKINVDGAVFYNQNCSGMGMVIRDSRGSFLAAKAVKLDSVREIEQVEALGILAGLDFAKEQGFSKILIEGDSKSVIDLINGIGMPRVSLEVIVEDIRRIAADFVFCKLSHIRRDGNSIAHTLIREALSESPKVWLGLAPDSIALLLSSEVNL